MFDRSLDFGQRPKHTTTLVLIALAIMPLGMFFSLLHSRASGMERSGLATAAAQDSKQKLWPISIDYPEDGSIFPPGITPPEFLWRDAAGTSWSIDISFEDKTDPIHVSTRGERLQPGTIDEDCVGNPDDAPRLTPQQAATWTWTPDAGIWSAIQSHSTSGRATITITGYREGGDAASQAQIAITTSTDPVGAPIFYRDVPLMPSKGRNGVVEPLAPSTIHLIQWRLRDIRSPESHTVLRNMSTCGNCHSFSADGKTMGMDVDGPANDKGLYAVVPVQRHMSIEGKDLVHWNTDGRVGQVRVGFMSQVSPD